MKLPNVNAPPGGPVRHIMQTLSVACACCFGENGQSAAAHHLCPAELCFAQLQLHCYQPESFRVESCLQSTQRGYRIACPGNLWRSTLDNPTCLVVLERPSSVAYIASPSFQPDVEASNNVSLTEFCNTFSTTVDSQFSSVLKSLAAYPLP